MMPEESSNNSGFRPPVIICTAGHIDHGKSCLIKALTGTDPDRLKEEKERGITIDLGFAFLNDRIAFIDVPGHEKFVKHMVAGAATVDYAMLVVAADDSVMPQTREHLDILNLLNVRGGLVVITKADLVDDELLNLVKDEIRDSVRNTVLQDAPVVTADSISGRGIEDVRKEILRISSEKQARLEKDIFRMPVDRIFSLKGFGTIVTGSVLSGKVRAGEKLDLLPQKMPVRIKGIQSQGKNIEEAAAGQRTALNLANISVDEVSRGDILATPDTLKPSRILLSKLKILSNSTMPLKNNDRVHVHIGTADLISRIMLLDAAEIESGKEGYAVLRLESGTAARSRDRFILRQYSPLMTIGGGIILDPSPAEKYRKRSELLEIALSLDSSELNDLIPGFLDQEPFSGIAEISVRLNHPQNEISRSLKKLIDSGNVILLQTGNVEKYCTASFFKQIMELAKTELNRFHQKKPLKAGMSQEEILSKIGKNHSSAYLIIQKAMEDRLIAVPLPGLLSLPDFSIHLTDDQEIKINNIRTLLRDSHLNPPSPEEISQKLAVPEDDVHVFLDFLADRGEILSVEKEIFFSKECITEAKEKLIYLFRHKESLTVSEIRQAFGSSRKYTVPLLVYFDSIGLTLRKEDVRFAGQNLHK
jgi:selenocysteine-specific elongation factor